jgi:hypothetical protein
MTSLKPSGQSEASSMVRKRDSGGFQWNWWTWEFVVGLGQETDGRQNSIWAAEWVTASQSAAVRHCPRSGTHSFSPDSALARHEETSARK